MPIAQIKKSTRFTNRLVLFSLLVIAVIVTLFVFLPKKNLPAAHAVPDHSFTLIIDPGHGGIDQGTSVYPDVKEKNITLAIAKEIRQLAPEYGISTELTRSGDVFMNPVQRVSFAAKQRADAYVSIHVNELRGYRNVSGMQVYVSDNNMRFDESCKLGSAIAKSLSSDFKIFPKLEDRAQNIFVLSENPFPSVLVECGFITNPEDLQMLTDSAKIKVIASQILSGVVAYREHHIIQLYAVQLPHKSALTAVPKTLIASDHAEDHKKMLKKNPRPAPGIRL